MRVRSLTNHRILLQCTEYDSQKYMIYFKGRTMPLTAVDILDTIGVISQNYARSIIGALGMEVTGNGSLNSPP